MSKILAVREASIGDAVADMWRSVLLFVPKAIAFIGILIVGWIVARAVLSLVDKVLERVGFDRALDRSGIGRALERTKYDASDILARLAYYIVLLFTLQLAFGVWGPNAISGLISRIVTWLPQAFIAIVIVVIAAAIANAVRDMVGSILGGLSYGRGLANVAAIFVLALGVIAALNQVGIAATVTTPILIAVLATVAGILIIGVGGGLVKPMQQRWEGWLTKVSAESASIRERAQAYSAGRGDMERQMADRAQQAHPAQPAGESAMAGAGRGQESSSGVYQSGNVSSGREELRPMSSGETPRGDQRGGR